jgi:hypothetical protein
MILTNNDERNFIRTLFFYEKFKNISIDVLESFKEFMPDSTLDINEEKELWLQSIINLPEPNVQTIKTRNKLVNPLLELLSDFFDLEMVTKEAFNNRHLAYLILIQNKKDWKKLTYLNAYDSVFYYRAQYFKNIKNKKKRLKYVLV